MVAVTPVRLGEPSGRFLRSAFGVWRSAFGGARLPNVQETSEAPMAYLAYLMDYLVTPAEPWASACHAAGCGKASGNAVGFAQSLIATHHTRWAAARRAQRGNPSGVQENQYPCESALDIWEPRPTNPERQTPNVT